MTFDAAIFGSAAAFCAGAAAVGDPWMLFWTVVFALAAIDCSRGARR